MYYYHDGENEVGPFSAEKLDKLATSGLIGAGTLVRDVNNSSWIPFSQLSLPSPSDQPSAAEYKTSPREYITPSHSSGDSNERWGNFSTTTVKIDSPSNIEEHVVKPRLSSAGWLAYPPTPWRRYGARMLDTTLNGLLMFSLFGIAFYAIAPATADEFFLIFEGEGARFLDVIITAFAASFLGGLLVGVSGFTLGKWIFGVKVTRLDETKLGIGAGLSRDFAVFLKGLGLGIPLVAIFTMGFSYRRLSEGKSTSWDEGKYIVWHRPSGASQYILNLVGVLLILLVMSGVAVMGAL